MKTFKTLATALCLAILASCNSSQQNAATTENTNGMKSENQVIETIMARRSIRQYKAEPVKRETMETILKCGIYAPSGMNKQSWEVRVVDNPQAVAKLKELLVQGNPQANPNAVEGCFRNAPTLIFVANDPSYDFSAIDCGLLSQNIMLSAWSLGVGSVCLGSPIRFLNNSPLALEMLGFTPGYRPIICIGLGYALESPEAKPRDESKIKYIE